MLARPRGNKIGNDMENKPAVEYSDRALPMSGQGTGSSAGYVRPHTCIADETACCSVTVGVSEGTNVLLLRESSLGSNRESGVSSELLSVSGGGVREGSSV